MSLLHGTFPSALPGPDTAARCLSSLITPTPTSLLLLSLTSVLSLHPAPHPLFVLLPHPSSSLLHLVFWPHTAAARSKETTLGQTQTFLSMLFAWSQYLRDKQLDKHRPSQEEPVHWSQSCTELLWKEPSPNP